MRCENGAGNVARIAVHPTAEVETALTHSRREWSNLSSCCSSRHSNCNNSFKRARRLSYPPSLRNSSVQLKGQRLAVGRWCLGGRDTYQADSLRRWSLSFLTISTSRVALGVASRIVQNLEEVQPFTTFLSFPLAPSSTDLPLARDLDLGASIDFPLDRDSGLAESSLRAGLTVARPADLW